ncbi:MAG TPA: FGGY family carbohydrate kinase, partial [Chloroflexota bacterium]|nr:FGGY family carbohydrate kinase [Chloroflexota bacterium]
MGDLILAIDQGSTSTRAVAFDRSLRPVAQASRAITASYPRPGWVEHDPDEIFNSVVTTVAEVLAEVGGSPQIAAVGLANQGETVVAWDNETGRPLGPAISWRCKRSHEIVDRLRAAGREPEVRSLTGLPLDPYFSASKLTWLLEEVPAVASASRAGRLRFGTVDAWLTWRLSGVALTDPSTASRTQLLDIHRLDWSDDLLGLFGIPRFSLPRISPSVGSLGYFRHSAWRGELPLRALVCDQQAALAGHGGFAPGALKATYGTGVFVLGNVGATLPPLSPELLATVAWAFPGEPATYALDGGVFAAAATVNWLRDGLRLVDEADQLDRLAAEVPDAGGVWVLPALAGLGAPWWSPRSRGVIAGLTDAVGRAHLARATLAGIAHGVCDVVEAMARYL